MKMTFHTLINFTTILILTLVDQKCSVKIGHFWQISDIHWDKQYSRTGDLRNMCHGDNSVTDNGFYGNSMCDTAWELVDLSIRAMKRLEPNPDFILWTGDNSPHLDYPNITWDMVYETCRILTQKLVQSFPSTVILPVLGNRDMIPSNHFPTNNPEFYQAFLTKGNWSYLIQEDQWGNFRNGGYYSTTIKPGLKVLVLNTGLIMTFNNLVTEEDSDPGGQFRWLLGELKTSRCNKEKVIITSHVSPGYSFSIRNISNLKASFSGKLVEMFVNNSDIILTTIFGHEHTDAFRLFKDHTGRFRTQALLGSSVNVWVYPLFQGFFEVNAGIRLYDYDLSKAMITDYRQYYVDFMEANENVTKGHVCSGFNSDGDAACLCSLTTSNACALMQLLYRPTMVYNVPDLGTNSMAKIYENLRQDPEIFEVFYNHSTLNYVVTPCDPSCRKWYLCAIDSITESDMTACWTKTESGP